MNAKVWDEAKNILCVRLDTIGDVLMTTPAIRALKTPYRGAGERQITLLTSGAGAAIARFVPEIDHIIVYDAPWLKATAPRLDSTPEYTMIEKLAALNFEAVVIFTVYSQNPLPAAFLGYMANIPLRLAHCHENPYQLLTNWVVDSEPEQGIKHEVQRQLDLVANVGCYTDDERMSLHVPEKAHKQVVQCLDALGLSQDQSWILIHPGATAPSRRYPPASFAEVARRLFVDRNCQIIFTGSGPDEQKLVQNIQQAMDAPSYSMVDRLDLGELAAIIGLAPLLIANNTGPVHIAAALGTPVVDIYALTNPQHTPWLVKHRVLSHDVPCKYCYKSVCPQGHHNCLRLVTPLEVVQAADELLSEAALSVYSHQRI